MVEDFNLLMDKGEFISLIGHSGCGKSTVLTMAAGLNAISKGAIVLDNREIDVAGPDKAVVFQAPSLMPWLTARQNVALGVERVYPHASQAERREIVDYYLDRVGLGDARTSWRRKCRTACASASASPAPLRSRPAAAARRAVRHARQPDALGLAGRAGRSVEPHQGDRDHGHPRRRRGDPARRPGGDDDQRPQRHDRQDAEGRPAAPAHRKALLDHARLLELPRRSCSISSRPTRAAPIRRPRFLEAIRSKRAAQSASGQTAAA